jgi:cold-inducible RNA-binding protein
LSAIAARPLRDWRQIYLSGIKSPDTKELKKMEVKLYVGNLSFSTTEDDIRNLFATAGSVTSVALIKDRDTGSSKGFAFVTMKFNGHTLGNRELKVNTARPKEETGGRGGYNSGGGDRNRRGGTGRY